MMRNWRNRLAKPDAYVAATCKPACRQTGFILFFFKIYSRSYGYEKKFFIEQNKIWLRLAHAALG